MKIGIAVLAILCAAGAIGAGQQPAAKPRGAPTQTHKTRKSTHTHRSRTRTRAKHRLVVHQEPPPQGNKDFSQAATAPPQDSDPCHSEHSFCATNLESASLAPAAVPEPPLTVAYQYGALSISAHDIPLGQILERIQAVTGAAVDAPPLEQRVTLRVDASAPVLAIPVLLDGLQLDYALAGGTSANDPLRRIILMPRAKPQVDAAQAKLPANAMQNQQPYASPAARSEQTAADEGVWQPGSATARPGRHH